MFLETDLHQLGRNPLDMKRQCLENGIDKIAMPRIGCGLDRLEWFVVEDMIKEIFQDTSIEIVIYVL